MIDELGDRMKDYESRFRHYINRRTYTIMRLDGKAFHTFTKGFKRPYDIGLMQMMDETAVALCSQIEGVKFAFVQSDEIQLLITDFAELNSGIWFDGNIQKMTSISASIATAAFNSAMARQELTHAPLALFDSRVFQVPQRIEAFNAFIWRQQDAVRNAITMAAQNEFSHRQLEGVKTHEMLSMLDEKGVDFSSYPAGFKRGRFIEKVHYRTDLEYIDKRTGETRVAKDVLRSTWEVNPAPLFKDNKEWLLAKIPE